MHAAATLGMKLKKKSLVNNFATIERMIDELKFEIDELFEKNLTNLGLESFERLQGYEKAGELQNKVTAAEGRLSRLKLSDEEISTAEFNRRKKQEQSRLTGMKKRLDETRNKLKPDEVEDDYLRNAGVDTEEEEDEDDDDDGGDTVLYHGEALSDFTAEQDDDLSFKKGDVLEILQTSDDGWWTGRLAGKTGSVPSTLIKVLSPTELKQTIDKRASLRAGKSTPTAPISTARSTNELSRSGKQLWGNVRKISVPPQSPSGAGVRTRKTSTADVLKAMKAVPSGFRGSTLGAMYKDSNGTHLLSKWVQPKFSESNLQFRDLKWDNLNQGLLAREVWMCRPISLVVGKMVPLLGTGLELLSRHAYVALWNQKEILSNVHMVKASVQDKDPQQWSFAPKIQQKTPTSLYDGDLVVRSNSTGQSDLAVLIELNYYCKRTSSGEKSELSCGWVSLPLFEADGSPAANKNFELKMNGGTPFEKGVELDGSMNQQQHKQMSSSSLMQSMIRVNREPRISVKLASPSKPQKLLFDQLPDCIIAPQRWSRFIGSYREALAKSYCRDEVVNIGLKCDPVLSVFPRAIQQADIFDALITTAEEREKAATRAEKQALNYRLLSFKQAFMEAAYPIMQCGNLPPFDATSDAQIAARATFILDFAEKRRTSATNLLLAPGGHFRPFNMSRIAFDVLAANSYDLSENG